MGLQPQPRTPARTKLVYLYGEGTTEKQCLLHSTAAAGVGWWRRKPGEQAAAFRGSLFALASAVRSLRCVVWCRGQCGVVWYGVVWWVLAMVLLRRIGSGPECMNLVQAATMLSCVRSLALLGLHVAHPPPSVRLFVSGRSFVASRKSKSFKLVRSLVGCMG